VKNHRLTILLQVTVLTLAAGTACAQEIKQEINKGDVPLGPPPVQASLPDLGSGANAILSRADEYQVGRMVMSNLRQETKLFEDPETVDYLQSVASRIGVEAQDGEQRLTLFAIRDPSINAGAMLGGFIGVNTGLILLTSNESELAGVMAHEIGHVVQRHMVRAIQAQGRSSLATMAAMLAGILLGAATGNADAIPGVVALAQGTAMQQQINFTRMEEHEADRVGIGYLAAAGYDPSAMAGFFSAMQRERGLAGDDIPPLLLDHPVDSVRIAEARARVAATPPYPRRPESPNYPFIRERVRVLAAGDDNDQRRYYERMRKNDPNNQALVYGAALAEIKSGSPQTAVDLLKPLVAHNPHLTLLQTALAQAQFAAGQKNDAAATFEHGLAVSPRNVPMTVHYAEALLEMDRAAKAHQLLLDLFNNVPPTPEQVRLIALAASAAGDTGDAYYYMSEYHIASGDLMLATTQLDLALAAPGLTEVQRKRFLARREEIRGYLREQRGSRSGRAQPQG
jgi:predicted Zn-dependent protease